jgi:hypothetical protein
MVGGFGSGGIGEGFGAGVGGAGSGCGGCGGPGGAGGIGVWVMSAPQVPITPPEL